VWAVPCLCEFYLGICLTTEEKARKNLSQGKKFHLFEENCFQENTKKLPRFWLTSLMCRKFVLNEMFLND